MKEHRIITANNFIRGLALLRYSVIRTGAWTILRGFWKSYYLVSLRRTRKLHDVTLPIDHKIPFYPKALRAYVTFYVPLIAFAGILYRQEGKNGVAHIKQLLLELAQLYRDAGVVFTHAQTSFKRTGGGFYVGLLRRLDKEKNSAPSVHVVVAALTYCRCAELVRNFQFAHADLLDRELKRVATRIIDSTLLIKQHCVQDVALGLALVAFRYPTYIPSMHVLIDEILEHSSVRLSPPIAEEVRTEIQRLFAERVRATGGMMDMEQYLAALPLREFDIGSL